MYYNTNDLGRHKKPGNENKTGYTKYIIVNYRSNILQSVIVCVFANNFFYNLLKSYVVLS